MENELYHYGVLGMKWGVRRTRKQLGYTTASQAHRKARRAGEAAAKDTINSMNASPKKHTLREYNNAARTAKSKAYTQSFKESKARNKEIKNEERALRKNPTKNMSDAELRQKINRLQMEKQYSQLTKAEKSTGQKFVSDILTNAAKQTASTYVSRYMTKGIDAAINAAMKKK